MSTRALIGYHEDGVGRYVHFDGSPDSLGVQLATIIERDGYNDALEQLLDRARNGWSYIDSEQNDEKSEPRFTIVPGYGRRYNDDDGDDWLKFSDGDTEWSYEFYENGICGINYYGKRVGEIDMFGTLVDDMRNFTC